MKKNEFIIGTHYYGNGSPINMWSTIDVNTLRRDLTQIESEGFNSIVLLIPWSGFQPDMNKFELNKKYIKLLRNIRVICEELNLKLIFRIGYLWDSTPSEKPTYMRFMNIAMDRKVMKSWSWFLKAIYNEVKVYQCYSFSFISWEDFYWPIYRHYQNVKNASDLNAFMYESGLQNYLLEMNSYMKLIDKDFEIDTSELPKESSKWYSLYTNFYDNFILRKIVDLSCISFPDLEVELRVDAEWSESKESTKSFHFWSQNYYNAKLPVIYYHANIAKKHDSVMTPNEATFHLSSLLDRYASMRDLGQNKPFVDQLNYFDDTYAKWGTVNVENSRLYAENMFTILQKMSSGYAIWGYRDWRKNIVHNPYFYLGSEGWIISKNVIFSKNSVVMKDDSSMSQKIPHLALDEGERHMYLKGNVEGESAEINLEVLYNSGQSTKKTLKLENGFFQKIRLEEKNRINGTTVSVAKGKVVFDEISIKGRVFSQGFATYDGELTEIGTRLVELQQEYKRENT